MRITQRGHTSRPSHDPQIFFHLLPLSLLFAAVLWDVIIAAVTSGPASLATGASALWQFPKCHSYWGHLCTQARQPTTSHSAGGLRSMRMWKSCSTFSLQRSFKFRFANLTCGDVKYWHSKKNEIVLQRCASGAAHTPVSKLEPCCHLCRPHYTTVTWRAEREVFFH